MASAGSNLGPTNQKLIDRVSDSATAPNEENPSLTVLPADLLATSGSGLDPDISPTPLCLKRLGWLRVAACRNRGVRDLINKNITGRELRRRGSDVVVGWVEPYQRPHTVVPVAALAPRLRRDRYR